jgi:hypothetical protein
MKAVTEHESEEDENEGIDMLDANEKEDVFNDILYYLDFALMVFVEVLSSSTPLLRVRNVGGE